MMKAQRVGNIYFAQFGLGAMLGNPGGGFEHTMAEIRRAVDSIGEVSRSIGHVGFSRVGRSSGRQRAANVAVLCQLPG